MQAPVVMEAPGTSSAVVLHAPVDISADGADVAADAAAAAVRRAEEEVSAARAAEIFDTIDAVCDDSLDVDEFRRRLAACGDGDGNVASEVAGNALALRARDPASLGRPTGKFLFLPLQFVRIRLTIRPLPRYIFRPAQLALRRRASQRLEKRQRSCCAV